MREITPTPTDSDSVSVQPLSADGKTGMIADGASVGSAGEGAAAAALYNSIRFGLVELETFLAVAELGSFSEAARRLNISQPSVTIRIQRLESMLNIRLLSRTTRRVDLTEAGLRLRTTAADALYKLRALLLDFQRETDQRRNRLVVATTMEMKDSMVEPLVNAFARQHLGTEVTIRTLHPDEVQNSVEIGEVDLALVRDENHPRIFDFDSIASEPFSMLVPRSHPIARNSTTTMIKASELPLMMLEKDSAGQAIMEVECHRRGLTPKHFKMADTMSGMLAQAAAGDGMALMPRSDALAHANHASLTCVDISDVQWTRSVGVLRLRGTDSAKLTYEFCDFLKQHFGGTRETGFDPAFAKAAEARNRQNS